MMKVISKAAHTVKTGYFIYVEGGPRAIPALEQFTGNQKKCLTATKALPRISDDYAGLASTGSVFDLKDKGLWPE